MKPKVYVETSVISYLTSWPSGDLIIAARQKITRDWWHEESTRYELIVCDMVLREASVNDLHSRRTYRGATMIDDPIVAEIRRVRHAHAAQFNNDIAAIFADYRRLEKESGRQYVTFPPRRPWTNREPAATS